MYVPVFLMGLTMNPLERSPSITTQAFDTVEQAGVCCTQCTPLPIVSAVGVVVVATTRTAHVVYSFFRHREQPDQSQRPREGRPEFLRTNSVVEFKTAISDSGSDSNSEVSTHRHVRIVLHKNSDDEIDQIEVDEIRNSG